jgi:hypothetical protein
MNEKPIESPAANPDRPSAGRVGLILLSRKVIPCRAARLTVVDFAYGREKERQEETNEIKLQKTCKAICRQEDEANK